LTCSSIDTGYNCIGEVGRTSSCFAVCGDSIRVASEVCDNGNQAGCSSGCRPDRGYTCTAVVGAASTCSTTCGDMIKAGDEECDNGKKLG
jgi:cysteine-rich repeat protein